MALPSVPPLTMLQILTEFSAPVGTLLTAMVRGGTYVPNTAANAGVPLAPPIAVLDFLGASATAAVTAATSDRTVSASALSPADATALYEVNFNGQVREALNNAASTFVENWLLSGVNTDYDVRATIVSGALSSGPVGVWTSGATGSAWTVARTSNLAGTTSCTFTLELRRTSDLVVIDSSTIILNATVDV